MGNKLEYDLEKECLSMGDMNAANGSAVIIMLGVAALIIWRRTRAMYKPMGKSAFRILLPLFFLSPGVLLFLQPGVHLTTMEVLGSIGIGIVFSIPLIWTTGYEIREDGHIYTKKSMAFVQTFLGILSLRFLLRGYLSEIDPKNMMLLIFLIAVCYLVPWRVACYVKYSSILEQRNAAQKTAGM
jgi:membrane protein CcdC involved in cytochrome C biogenesis